MSIYKGDDEKPVRKGEQVGIQHSDPTPNSTSEPLYNTISSPAVIIMQVAEDNTVVINENDLLANVINLHNSNLRIINITAPQGALIDHGDGTWSFTHAINFNGRLNLTATITDGNTSISQIISLDVMPN